MSTIDRFRVDKANSDLLRTRTNARAAVKGELVKDDGYWVRKVRGKTHTDPKGPYTRAEALDAYDRWALGAERFVIGRKHLGVFVPTVSVKHETVELLPVTRCSVAVSLLWSLVKHQFPNALFAGGYVDKDISGKPGQVSDHAWGDAFDVHPQDNDRVFAWLVSMAIAGCTQFDYAIGSKAGAVVYARADGSYAVRPGGGDSSHLWHIHVSVIDHDGQAPPHVGGR